jgi:uncharacterized membrane protein
MSKYTIIITLAVWIIILPFLGFPSFWRTLLIVLSALGIIFYAFLLRSESSNVSSFGFSKNNGVYVENGINDNVTNEEKIQSK